MNQDDFIRHIKRLQSQCQEHLITGAYAEICEFLRTYGGPKNAFLESVKKYDPSSMVGDYAAANIRDILRSYLQYVEAGLATDISPERKAQIDVVSDFLEMGQRLLATSGVHPAAPAVIIGASLEEYLRNWVERENLPLGNRKPGIDNYCQILREADLITKQDAKDITSWAGVRNHAAHGEWDLVNDPKRISLMLEGVNLFMRKNSP